MVNTSRPAGLSPAREIDGDAWSGGVNIYYVPSTDGTVIAVGDPVKSAGSASADGIPDVTLGTAGSAVRGVVIAIGAYAAGSIYADPDQLSLRVLPATKTKNYVVAVADDPGLLFEVEEDSVGGALAATDVGLNADLVAGTNNGYVSGWLLDSSTKATTATLNCKIMRLVPRSDNAIGASAKWWVKLNNHELNSGTGTAGV